MNKNNSPILVTGGTGAQGGATARALLAAGYPVRALARSPESPAAQALLKLGASVVAGDMDDPASLVGALQGIYGVFSVQVPDSSGTDSERKQGFALVDAALQAGVQHFVHTSVCEAGKHTNFARWDSGYWWQKYWTDKWDIEERVRHAGFPIWTVLKPAFMLDNFTLPKSQYMFPHLGEGKIITAFHPQTRMQLTTADDVGAFARAAFEHPDLYKGKNIDLANEALSMDEVAALLSRVLHRTVISESVSPEQAVAAGLFPGWVRSQEWTNEVGYRADIQALAAYDVPLTPLEQWVETHASGFPG
ncbi:NmrA family NAD(P)-binding protein [Pseudomonas sp. GB2N2]